MKYIFLEIDMTTATLSNPDLEPQSFNIEVENKFGNQMNSGSLSLSSEDLVMIDDALTEQFVSLNFLAKEKDYVRKLWIKANNYLKASLTPSPEIKAYFSLADIDMICKSLMAYYYKTTTGQSSLKVRLRQLWIELNNTRTYA